jgi:hypothetical protein
LTSRGKRVSLRRRALRLRLLWRSGGGGGGDGGGDGGRWQIAAARGADFVAGRAGLCFSAVVDPRRRRPIRGGGALLRRREH